MAILKIDPTKGHPLGWVKTRLKAGDELGSYKGHTVEASRDLASLYSTTAQAIVENNGVKFDTDPINGWVLATGGVKLPNGQPVFHDTSVIFLPPGGPRVPAGAGGGGGGGGGSMVVPVVAGLALLGVVAFVATRKKAKP